MNNRNLLKIGLVIAVAALIGYGVWAISKSGSTSQGSARGADVDKTVYTRSEVAAHNTSRDCWTIIDDEVYDLTRYIGSHPGGAEITRACGVDGTTLFEERLTSDGQVVGSGTPHSAAAEQQLESLQIGVVED